MKGAVSLKSSMPLLALVLVGGCAAPGPGYDDVTANAGPMPEGAARLVFLRPRDGDDGSNGGAASIEVNRESVGALRYGGFFYLDINSGTTALTTFGRYRTLGACEIDIAASPGSHIYVDVGPRLSYMIASAVGGVVGGVAGAAAVPNVYGSAGAAIATSTAAMAAGSTAGTVAAAAVESRGKECRGPYKLELIAEEDALPRLKDLTWSKD